MIIDNTKPEFEHLPNNANGEVLLLENVNGRLTCPQETAYMFAVATLEQQQYAGHNQYNYSGLDLAVCKKPDIDDVTTQYKQIAQERLNELDLPDQAKTGLQNRINAITADARTMSLDDALRLALQLPIDIRNKAT